VTSDSIREEIKAEEAKPDGERDEQRLKILYTELEWTEKAEAEGLEGWTPMPVTNWDDLWLVAGQARRLGYGGWRISISPANDLDPACGGHFIFRADKEYLLTGIADPDRSDRDAGMLALEFEEVDPDFEEVDPELATSPA